MRAIHFTFPALLGAAFLASALSGAQPSPSMKKPFGLVIHGGAGVVLRENINPELEAEYRAKLTEARDAGYAILERGGSAMDAVIAAVTIMEDSPLFNAGKGAVLNADGICELDASVMDGRTQAAGAVASVRRIQNPITLARAVMEKSEHVMLAGDGAEKFAQERGFALVENSTFQTARRRSDLERAKQLEAAKTAPGKKSATSPTPAADGTFSLKDAASLATTADDAAFDRQSRYGTVGCAALDQHGNLAAGTSTGGRTNKKYGRIGDAPIIGAGTYANNATCAVSATGWGEFFIRTAVAHDISAQMEYRGTPLADAANATLAKVAKLGGDGGVVCIDKDGNIALPFNTAGMYRGYRVSNGVNGIELFKE
jgi:beta-aspartyl-peptidase (threonine type)